MSVKYESDMFQIFVKTFLYIYFIFLVAKKYKNSGVL